jgi:NAD(P)-dependent dehydrogenase (short-subunit alcohol dehydrogenase family)/acyl carrier protein
MGRRPEEFDGLVSELRRAGDIVHECRDVSEAASLPAGASVVFFQGSDAASLIRLLGCVTDSTRVWVVTRNAEISLSQMLNTACGDDHLAGAALRGIARVFATEQPDCWGGIIDFDTAHERNGVLLARLLLQARAGTCEDRIAVHQGRTYVPRLARESSQPSPISFDSNGVCLITGGTGGIGAHLARWLVGRGVRRLVLAGKRGAAHPDAAALEDELRHAGATQVDIVAVDVADRSQVDDLVRRYTPRSVFHTAGTVADGTIPSIRESDLHEVMSAKAMGAWHLHQATAGLELSHFVLFSSAVTVLGMSGLAAYTAANEFLNELAWMRRGMGLPAQSIAWSGWNNTGMAASAGAARVQQWRTFGLEPLSVADGLRGFEAALSNSAACLAWMDVHWDQYLARFPRGRVPAFFSAFALPTAADATSPAAAGRAASHDEQSIRTFIADRIRGLACDAADDLADEDSLFDLGIDSLMAVELRNGLSRELSVNLSATALFDYPLFGDLVQYVCREAGIETQAARAERMLETLSDSELRTLELSLTGRPQ